MVDFILKDTDISKIYRSGQCFGISQNPYRVDEYWCVSGNKFSRVIYQGSNESLLTCFDGDLDYWLEYFDMNTDYLSVADEYINIDGTSLSRDIVELCGGLRMLRQEFSDCLISFITSQRKSVGAIRTAISKYCEKWGNYYNLDEYFGSEYMGYGIYTFPSMEKYSSIGIEELEVLGFGYRAPYIVSALGWLSESGVKPERLGEIGYSEAKRHLMGLHGVGEKIANCVLLYSLGYRGAYPRDIWIQRFEEEYCNGRFNEELYGDRAGIIQLWQYYFMLNGR